MIVDIDVVVSIDLLVRIDVVVNVSDDGFRILHVAVSLDVFSCRPHPRRAQAVGATCQLAEELNDVSAA